MISIEETSVVDIRDLIDRSPLVGVEDAHAIVSSYIRQSVFVWTGKVDDKVACVWGLIPPTILSNRAYLWLLTTDLVEDNRFMFIRWSQRYVEHMLTIFPEIHGYADTRFKNNIRWLKWLGAKFTDKEGYGAKFVIRKKDG